MQTLVSKLEVIASETGEGQKATASVKGGDEFLNLSDPKHVHKRAHARSYDTPLITRAYRSVNAPLGPELAAIRFLERMGYDVHYATGFDLSGKHADSILKRSRAYLSVGHDEYWTRGARVHRASTPSTRRSDTQVRPARRGRASKT